MEAISSVVGTGIVYLTPTILAELWYGVHRATDVNRRVKSRAFVSVVHAKECLVLDETTAEIVGRLAAGLDNVGRPTTHRLNDLWIAAAAIQYSLHVLTRNPKDFADIPGLSVAII